MVTLILSNTHRVKFVNAIHVGTEPGTGTVPGTGPGTDTGTDQGKSQNIYREQVRAQLADSQYQNRNRITLNAKQEQRQGLVKRNSFPHWGIRLYISV